MIAALDASVVICAHNPRPHFLRRTLEALRAQTLPLERWELLLVDNASAEPLSTQHDLSWHPGGRHLVESQLGLAPARRLGMRESAAALLVFVDDDNVLDPDYLRIAVDIGRNWPMLGVWGSGKILPEFEVPLPEQLRPYSWLIAVVDRDRATWCSTPTFLDAIPIGAGLCMRASVADAYRRHCETTTIAITGRQGKALIGCEDTEICFVAGEIGLGVGVFPELRISHLMPRERLTDDYFLRLQEGTSMSESILAYKWREEMVPGPFSPRMLLSLMKTLVLRRGFERKMYFARLRGLRNARTWIGERQAIAEQGEHKSVTSSA